MTVALPKGVGAGKEILDNVSDPNGLVAWPAAPCSFKDGVSTYPGEYRGVPFLAPSSVMLDWIDSHLIPYLLEVQTLVRPLSSITFRPEKDGKTTIEICCEMEPAAWKRVRVEAAIDEMLPEALRDQIASVEFQVGRVTACAGTPMGNSVAAQRAKGSLANLLVKLGGSETPYGFGTLGPHLTSNGTHYWLSCAHVFHKAVHNGAQEVLSPVTVSSGLPLVIGTVDARKRSGPDTTAKLRSSHPDSLESVGRFNAADWQLISTGFQDNGHYDQTDNLQLSRMQPGGNVWASGASCGPDKEGKIDLLPAIIPKGSDYGNTIDLAAWSIRSTSDNLADSIGQHGDSGAALLAADQKKVCGLIFAQKRRQGANPAFAMSFGRRGKDLKEERVELAFAVDFKDIIDDICAKIGDFDVNCTITKQCQCNTWERG